MFRTEFLNLGLIIKIIGYNYQNLELYVSQGANQRVVKLTAKYQSVCAGALSAAGRAGRAAAPGVSGSWRASSSLAGTPICPPRSYTSVSTSPRPNHTTTTPSPTSILIKTLHLTTFPKIRILIVRTSETKS